MDRVKQLEQELKEVIEAKNRLENELVQSRFELDGVCKNITLIQERDKQIKKLQEQITTAAYQDGLAESAISVLHNIGNVLTAVVGEASDGQAIEQFAMANNVLEKIVKRLEALTQESQRQDKCTSEVEKMLPLLHEILKNYQECQVALAQSMESIAKKSIHIGKIISTQQRFVSKKGKMATTVSIKEVINDCLLLQKDNLEEGKIKVHLDVHFDHYVKMDKIGLSQLVLNMIVNAREAIGQRKKSDPYYKEKEITIHSEIINQNVELTIADNGIGIDKENLEKVFGFGFSTKNRGSGFGLHNSANFINANAGQMKIESEGTNKGAKVTILCPYSPCD